MSVDKAQVTVEVEGRRIRLAPDEEVIFGRDSSCHVRLDPDDTGISRLAGRIAYGRHGWTITNLSRKRALHVVDPTGFAVPLPVSPADGPPSCRAVDQPRLTILVPGELWTHAITVQAAVPSVAARPAPTPQDPVSTRSQMPPLTERRREVLVAMARGYLRPYPHYDPRPLTYQQVADLLGLGQTQVRRRIEDVREELVRRGVPGLDREPDARRPLCEWLLATRIITPADLTWLQPRIDAARAARRTPTKET